MGNAGPLQLLLGALALGITTIATIAIDKKIRSSSSDFALPMTEPGWGVLLLLTFLCNIAALPFYFYRARGSVVWALGGVLLTGVCIVCMFIGNIVGAILDTLLHLR